MDSEDEPGAICGRCNMGAEPARMAVHVGEGPAVREARDRYVQTKRFRRSKSDHRERFYFGDKNVYVSSRGTSLRAFVP